MARKRKSSFYHTRWNRVHVNEEYAAEILGVSVEQIKDWDIYGNDLAERFLLLWDKKHVNLHGWHGWLFSRDLLMFKGQHFDARSILQDRKDALELLDLQFRTKKLINELSGKSFRG